MPALGTALSSKLKEGEAFNLVSPGKGTTVVDPRFQKRDWTGCREPFSKTLALAVDVSTRLGAGPRSDEIASSELETVLAEAEALLIDAVSEARGHRRPM
jgi:hypothetical protein